LQTKLGVRVETAAHARRRVGYDSGGKGKAPDFVIEITSKSTRKEDLEKKFLLYRDVLKVPVYVLFDPFEEYLKPSLQGYRLTDGRYEPIPPRGGRLASAVLGLELERSGSELRVRDPGTGRWLATPGEQAAALRERDDEIERLRRESERLKGGGPWFGIGRKRLPGPPRRATDRGPAPRGVARAAASAAVAGIHSLALRAHQ
jgi:hypothetical protein